MLNAVHGAQTAEALIAAPEVQAVSFVGSAPVARHIYEEVARHGKRVQALGGAKNHIVVMPDADLTTTIPAILGSALGNAGERCLAGSVAVAVGDATRPPGPLCEQTRQLVVGPGDQPGVDVGPLIRAEHRDWSPTMSTRGRRGRHTPRRRTGPARSGKGFFLGPTILSDIKPAGSGTRGNRSCAIPGPCPDAGGGDWCANQMALGNMAVIFTRDGRAVRGALRDGVEAAWWAWNVPVAQPRLFPLLRVEGVVLR